MMRKRLSVILLLVLLISCNSIGSKKSTEVNAYPQPENDIAVTAQQVATDLKDTPISELGSVIGILYYKKRPLAAYTFFLADVLTDKNTGLEISTALDRSTAPQAITDETGRLEFRNVPPGRYGLTLLEGLDTFLLLNPENGDPILITVKKGDKIDFGKYDYDDLPID